MKNGGGGLINALELEVLGVDSILVCKLQRFKSQRGAIGGGIGGVESSDGDGDFLWCPGKGWRS